MPSRVPSPTTYAAPRGSSAPGWVAGADPCLPVLSLTRWGSLRNRHPGRPHMSIETEREPAAAPGEMSVPTLTGMVVGSMVGAGVFSLPARFGVATGLLGSLIAWAVAGSGMLMLVFLF